MKSKKHNGMTVKSVLKPKVSILRGATYTKSEHTNLAEKFKAIFEAQALAKQEATAKVTPIKERKAK